MMKRETARFVSLLAVLAILLCGCRDAAEEITTYPVDTPIAEASMETITFDLGGSTEATEAAQATEATESQETTGETQRVLTQVNWYQSGAEYAKYTFTYGENSLLTRYSYEVPGDNRYSECDIEYNEKGQVVRCKTTSNVNPDREYDYSDDGILTGWSYWEYDAMQVRYTCEYDGQGRRIREYAGGSSDDFSINTVYTYGDDGLLLSSTTSTIKGDMKGTETCTYTYDDDGRLMEKENVADWWGYVSTDTEKYSYEYDPFVLCEVYSDGSHMRTNLVLLQMEADSLVSLTLNKTPSFETVDGYLTKITAGDDTYEFLYEDILVHG